MAGSNSYGSPSSVISDHLVTGNPNSFLIVDNSVLSLLSSIDRFINGSGSIGGATATLDRLFSTGRQIVITDTVQGEALEPGASGLFRQWIDKNIANGNILVAKTGFPMGKDQGSRREVKN
jgi:hypothetical protein